MTISNKPWLETLNKFSSKVIMPILAVLIFLYNTVINRWLGGSVESAENILFLVVLGIVGLNVLFGGKENFKAIIKSEYLVILYFIVRALCIIKNGFDYTIIRSVLLEMFFLAGIGWIHTYDKKELRKYMNLFLVMFFIFAIPSLAVFLVGPPHNPTFAKWLYLNTYYTDWVHMAATFFANPNTAGIMSAFAAIILYTRLKKVDTKKEKGIYIGLILFCVCYLMIQRCRSGQLGLLLVFGIEFLKYIHNRLNSNRKVPKKDILEKKKMVFVIFALCLLAILAVYGLITIHHHTYYNYLSPIETTINKLSSNRYAIWKGCSEIQMKNPILGAGSLSRDQQLRETYLTNPKIYYSSEIVKGTKRNPHNGYIGMISVTGWAGYILFLLIMFKKFKDCKLLKKDQWYMFVCFFLVVNLFECLVIINRFFLLFYLFIILNGEDNEKGMFINE